MPKLPNAMLHPPCQAKCLGWVQCPPHALHLCGPICASGCSWQRPGWLSSQHGASRAADAIGSPLGGGAELLAGPPRVPRGIATSYFTHRVGGSDRDQHAATHGLINGHFARIARIKQCRRGFLVSLQHAGVTSAPEVRRGDRNSHQAARFRRELRGFNSTGGISRRCRCHVDCHVSCGTARSCESGAAIATMSFRSTVQDISLAPAVAIASKAGRVSTTSIAM